MQRRSYKIMATGKRDITAKGKEKEMDKGKARRDTGTEKKRHKLICEEEKRGLV